MAPSGWTSIPTRLARDGEEVALTAGEFNLLRIFVEHPNRVLSRDSLMDLIKGYERTPFDRSIDVRVTRLRRKIENDPAAPVYIRTVWGEGYLFAPQGKAHLMPGSGTAACSAAPPPR